jgi:hypothetical protein
MGKPGALLRLDSPQTKDKLDIQNPVPSATQLWTGHNGCDCDAINIRLPCHASSHKGFPILIFAGNMADVAPEYQTTCT